MQLLVKLFAFAIAVCLEVYPLTGFGKEVVQSQTLPGIVGTAALNSVVVRSVSGPLGSYLTDEQGRSLYMFEIDTAHFSNCYGECAQAWPPFHVSSGQNIFATGNALSSLLSTFTQTDGTQQITYNGMPLYYYVHDQKPGDTTGHGVYGSGGLWYLVQPTGEILR